MKSPLKNMSIGWLALLLVLVSAGSLLAHHSLGNFDTTKAVRVKGMVVQFNLINPHSILFLEEKVQDANPRRWAVEGPSVIQLSRSGFTKDSLKVGDVVEICGYLPKENVTWQLAMPENGTSIAGKLINGESMVLPDGKQRDWGDYGFHKCFEAGYTDQHSR